MHEDEARLLASIRAEPAADGPRIVYADWLTQQGDPRGELIVIQCEIERAPEKREDLEKRAREIMPIVPDLAFDMALPVDRIVVGDPTPFSRGFVLADRVFCHVEEFAERKDMLYRFAPFASHLWMYNFGSKPPWDAVLADPDVTRWGDLRGIPTSALANAAKHAHLDALHSVTIQAGEGEEEAEKLDPLFEHGRFANLHTLRVDGLVTDGMSPGLPALDDERWQSAAFAPTLREFDGEMLANLDVFPKLESFSSYYYGAEWLREIAAFGGSLKTLDIGPYDDEALAMDTLAVLLRAPSVKGKLETLRLTLDLETSHTSTAWRLLDDLPLRTLALRGDWVDHALVGVLAGLPELRELRLARRYTPLAPAALSELFAKPWPKLETLDLGTEPLEDATLVEIFERLPALRHLRCGARPTKKLFERLPLGRLDVLEMHSKEEPFLPPEFPTMRAAQFQFSWLTLGFHRTYAELWAADRGMRLLPRSTSLRSRGDDALTFIRWPPVL